MKPGTRVRITSPTAMHGRVGRVVTTDPTPTELAVYVQLDGERIPLRFGASVVERIEED